MKIKDRFTGHEPEGDFVWIDDFLDLEEECPICGAEYGQQCSVEDPEHPCMGIELGGYIHEERVKKSLPSKEIEEAD